MDESLAKRVEVLEGLLQRGLDLVEGQFAGRTANAGDGRSVGLAMRWANDVIDALGVKS